MGELFGRRGKIGEHSALETGTDGRDGWMRRGNTVLYCTHYRNTYYILAGSGVHYAVGGMESWVIEGNYGVQYIPTEYEVCTS